MPNQKKGDFELDYVYLANDDMEFRSVRVLLNIGDESVVMTLLSDQTVASEDLSEILEGLQKGAFKKMQFRLGENCEVFIITNGERFLINIENSDLTKLSLVKA